jgi:cardiolipin synthase (CMP-forming)
MNIPNLLSIFRLVVTVFFVVAIEQEKYRLGLLLFVLQGVSDFVDGFLARVLNKRTALGAFLDPIADKAMLVSSYIVLCHNDIIPLWVTMVVILKDVVVACGFLILYIFVGKLKLIPTIWGKITTTLQIITVVYLLWFGKSAPYQSYFYYVTVLFTVIAGVQYMYRGVRVLTKKEAV